MVVRLLSAVRWTHTWINGKRTKRRERSRASLLLLRRAAPPVGVSAGVVISRRRIVAALLLGPAKKSLSPPLSHKDHDQILQLLALSRIDNGGKEVWLGSEDRKPSSPSFLSHPQRLTPLLLPGSRLATASQYQRHHSSLAHLPILDLDAVALLTELLH